MEQTTKQVSNREHKASAFTTYFSDPENAAKLYSALEGTRVSPDEIHFATLQGVLYVLQRDRQVSGRKNLEIIGCIS